MTNLTRADAFVINMARDRDRRRLIEEQSAALPQINFVFVSGVDACSVPFVARETLVRSSEWAKLAGTLGCFLAHVSAWEKVARLDQSIAIVMEDDVEITALDGLFDLDIGSDAELVFINDRLSLTSDQKELCPLIDALKKLDAIGGQLGADGYLLTPAGARKLLAACATDLFYGHVDGRLLRYATSEHDLTCLGLDSHIASIIRNHHNPLQMPKLGIVKGYVSPRPLLRHRGLPSVREYIDIEATK